MGTWNHLPFVCSFIRLHLAYVNLFSTTQACSFIVVGPGFHSIVDFICIILFKMIAHIEKGKLSLSAKDGFRMNFPLFYALCMSMRWSLARSTCTLFNKSTDNNNEINYEGPCLFLIRQLLKSFRSLLFLITSKIAMSCKLMLRSRKRPQFYKTALS